MGEKMRFSGIINPAAWDEQGNVTAYEIATYKEEEYLLAGDEWQEKLAVLLHQKVEVCGTLNKNEKGKKQLHIDSLITFSGKNIDM